MLAGSTAESRGFDGESSEGRAAELVVGIHTGSHASAFRARPGGHERFPQSADAARFSHAGDGGRQAPFCLAENRGRHAAGNGGMPYYGAERHDVFRIPARGACADAWQVSGALNGGRDLPDHAGSFRER